MGLGFFRAGRTWSCLIRFTGPTVLRNRWMSSFSIMGNHSLIYPMPGVAKQPHPGAVLMLPVFRYPGILFPEEHPFGVRHDDGDTAIFVGKAVPAMAGTIRVGRIGKCGPALIIDKAQHRQRPGAIFYHGTAFAMRCHDRDAG